MAAVGGVGVGVGVRMAITGREREERRVGLGGRVAAVIAADGHAVVAEHEQQRALAHGARRRHAHAHAGVGVEVVEEARHVLDHRVHLRQLGRHIRVVRAVPVENKRIQNI